MAIGLGLDVGGTKVLGIATAENGQQLAEVRVASPHQRQDLLVALGTTVSQLLSRLGPAAGDVVGIGIGLPGLVEPARGALHSVPNLPAAEGFRLGQDLTPRLAELLASHGAPPARVTMDNDATCAAAGESMFGAAQGKKEAVVVTVGTGIGGGLISGGKVLRGARGFAGEVGHMVIQVDGPPCGCGNRGCFEQLASGSGLARLAREALAAGRLRGLSQGAGRPDLVRGEDVLDLARQGDPDALEIFSVVGRYLAVGLSNLAEVMDPDVLILSGGLVRAGDYLVKPTLESFARYSSRATGIGAVPVRVALLGDKAGAVGAAAIALGQV